MDCKEGDVLILSTKGRYGLKAMFVLALNEGGGPTTLKYIAKHQNLSEQYLEQLMSQLKKAKLVKSVRGAQGGYLLAKPSEEIRVGDVIRVLEGPLVPSECVMDEDSECENSDFCVTKEVWEKMKNSINSVMDGITLKDMVKDHHKKMQTKIDIKPKDRS